MHDLLMQHLKKVLKPDAFDDFMQNVAIHCSVEDVRGMD